MVLSVGSSIAYFARNARCTVTTELLVWYSNTQNDFSPRAAIFSLHTLASPSGRNMNYLKNNQLGEKKILSCSFYLYRFRKYVSYGFPIINFCNPGVHYKTPCIKENLLKLFNASQPRIKSDRYTKHSTWIPTLIVNILATLQLAWLLRTLQLPNSCSWNCFLRYQGFYDH